MTAAEPGRVLVVGGGAIGCLYAAGIAEAGAETWVLDHRPETVAALANDGVVLEEAAGSRTVRVHATLDPAVVPPADLVLLLVKQPALDAAAAAAGRALGPDGFAVALQNGFGHGERVASHLPRARVLHGVTYAGAVRTAPGRIVPTGYEPTVFGPLDPRPLEELAGVAALLARAGFGPRLTADPVRGIWEKSAVACALNAATALVRCRLGGLAGPAGRELTTHLLREAIALAAVEGVQVDRSDLDDTLARLVDERAETVPSMLQDVLSGRPTENASLNGYVAARSAAHGLDAPWNACVAALVGAVEESTAARVSDAPRSAPD